MQNFQDIIFIWIWIYREISVPLRSKSSYLRSNQVHPSLILQKHFLTHFNLVRHVMASIITTALFFLCWTNVFNSCLMYVCSHGDRKCEHGIKCFFLKRVFTFIPFNSDYIFSLSFPMQKKGFSLFSRCIL